MSLPPLIQGLLDPGIYPHPVGRVDLIETHISWVLIAGEYAYKIKKPIDLGFLDFSSLDKRRHCCEEEIRLNRRLAPDIYLEAVAITGSEQAPGFGAAGTVLEWAVKMQAFAADATLDREDRVSVVQIDAIADRIAAFHGQAEAATADSPYGTPEAVMYPVRENFRQIRALLPRMPAAGMAPALDRLEAWSEAQFSELRDHFQRRKSQGHIRDCHGDLHLGNIAWVKDSPLVFDCIEFNPSLRCIDPISEIAFLAMDLFHRGQGPQAWRLVNRWLEHAGDFAGMRAFRFYLVYRAMVRCKVACIRGSQDDPDALQEAMTYLDLAESLALGRQPYLVLMHGFSGCGKTWLSQQLLETLGCLRLRSDVERKRLAGLAAEARSHSGLKAGLYSSDATRLTFEHLLATTAMLLAAGFPVIVDATFLRRAARQPFLELARELGIPLRIVSLRAPVPLLQARVSQREEQGRDASEAGLEVLAHQLQAHDSLAQDELEQSLVLEAVQTDQWPETAAAWLEALHLTQRVT